MADDVTAGSKPLLQRARGYVATLVAGQPIFEGRVATGLLPGRLVRGSAAD